MKKTITIILILLISVSAFSQNNQDYMMVMVKQKKSFRMARTIEDFQGLADNFERVANANTDQWHPLYYGAFCYINMSFIEKVGEKKDGHLDKAQELVNKAIEIYPEESELFVLQGLLYQGRLQIDPATRGREYSTKATNAFNKAKEFNLDNPRAYYLLGMNILHTPKSMGGGAATACPIIEKAKEKFKEDVPDHVLSPTWGGEENQELYNKNCHNHE